MQIGVLKCTVDPIVAVVPDVAVKYIKLGYEVAMERGAGKASLISDESYAAAGVSLIDREEVLDTSDILVTVSHLHSQDIARAKPHAVLIGQFGTRSDPEWARELEDSPLMVFSLDRLPRTSVAQSMDVLSALSSLAGYKAVINAAERLSGYFPMLSTAAGTIPPARVLVLGAGVAGLQAIATARRLGAVVEAFDVRHAAKEEVASLGATFVEVQGAAEDAKAGGYAISQSQEYKQRQIELIHSRAVKSDVVICTAQVPGREAPKLLEARTAHQMKPGSVIVDMAASTGGNCELTINEEEIVVNDVTIVGRSKLHNELPIAASKLFANNLFNFIKLIYKDGAPNFEHEIATESLLGDPPVLKDLAS